MVDIVLLLLTNIISIADKIRPIKYAPLSPRKFYYTENYTLKFQLILILKKLNIKYFKIIRSWAIRLIVDKLRIQVIKLNHLNRL